MEQITKDWKYTQHSDWQCSAFCECDICQMEGSSGLGNTGDILPFHVCVPFPCKEISAEAV